MGVVRILDPVVANKIAAGEVVERPASVVKELIENALDAGATRVQVETAEGGLSRIEVIDNGVGMSAEDARLAFERHATSKLQNDRDLFRITTLGFRGEALPSIASVSRVTLITREKGTAATGTQVEVEGGVPKGEREVAANEGTRVVVSDLFFNTPARLKYMRALATEAGHVTDYVSRMAIARPDVAFSLVSDGRAVLSTTGRGGVLQAFTAVFGVDVARRSIQVNRANGEYQVTGVIGLPELARASRLSCLFYVNGRSVRSPALLGAVRQAFANRIPDNRYPLLAIDIAMDPVLVDVNVHPAKAEVRFSEERDVTRVLQSVIRDALDGHLLTPMLVVTQPNGVRDRPVAEKGSGNAKGMNPDSLSWDDLGAKRGSERSTQRTGWSEAAAAMAREVRPEGQGRSYGAPGGPGVFEGIMSAMAPVRSSSADGADAAHSSDTDTPLEAPTEQRGQLRLRVVGQTLGMYIIAQDDEALYIIDQHAAHERILFEAFSQQMRDKAAFAMPLVAPIPVDVPIGQADRLEGELAPLEEIGLRIERFGPTAFAARSVPIIWEGLSLDKLIRETVDEFLESGRTSVAETMMERVIMRACKAAVKANEWMDMREMRALCDALSALENPFACPHGRPVLLRISDRQLAAQFKRT